MSQVVTMRKCQWGVWTVKQTGDQSIGCQATYLANQSANYVSLQSVNCQAANQPARPPVTYTTKHFPEWISAMHIMGKQNIQSSPIVIYCKTKGLFWPSVISVIYSDGIYAFLPLNDLEEMIYLNLFDRHTEKNNVKDRTKTSSACMKYKTDAKLCILVNMFFFQESSNIQWFPSITQ